MRHPIVNGSATDADGHLYDVYYLQSCSHDGRCAVIKNGKKPPTDEPSHTDFYLDDPLVREKEF